MLLNFSPLKLSSYKLNLNFIELFFFLNSTITTIIANEQNVNELLLIRRKKTKQINYKQIMKFQAI